MTTLMDLANTARKVQVGDISVDVYGISTEGFAALLVRFPAIMKAMSGLQPDTESLAKIAPEAVNAMIAAGCGFPNDPEAEKTASRLPINDQLNLLMEIIRLTFPQGVGPFVERLKALGVLVRVEDGQPQEPAASPQSPSSQEPSKS